MRLSLARPARQGRRAAKCLLCAADTTSSSRQSIMLFTSLKDRGVPTRHVSSPRERLGFREPRHQRARSVEEVAWMQSHVIGQAWEPWGLPE